MNRIGTFRKWIRPLTALLLTAALCEPGADLWFDNQTDQTLQVLYVVSGSGDEIIIAEIEPGDRAASSEECFYSDLIARKLDGTVLAERPGPICQGDPPWVITEDPAT